METTAVGLSCDRSAERIATSDVVPDHPSKIAQNVNLREENSVMRSCDSAGGGDSAGGSTAKKMDHDSL